VGGRLVQGLSRSAVSKPVSKISYRPGAPALSIPTGSAVNASSPAYRVYFWQSAGSGEGPGWQSDEWELTEADIYEVLAWADARAVGRTMSIG